MSQVLYAALIRKMVYYMPMAVVSNVASKLLTQKFMILFQQCYMLWDYRSLLHWMVMC